MKKILWIACLCTALLGIGKSNATLVPASPWPSSLSHSTLHSDSIRAEQWLAEAKSLPKDSCRTLYFAQRLWGVPYVAHTLDQGKDEALVSRLDALDCTTFVETVVALTLTEREGETAWSRFRYHLQRLRYRKGQRTDYASRLHYFSDWIADNEQKGIVRERTGQLQQAEPAFLNLNFMSTHPQSYLQLRHHPTAVKQMAQIEQKWQNRQIAYLPKAKLNASPTALDIRNGDILALTTSIPGLDVVHVGFAQWINGRLHLVHASSKHRRVLQDPQPLYEYSRSQKAHTGIRVISVCTEE